MTTHDKSLGAVHDLTVATEFLMCAVRGITIGTPHDAPAVQEFINLALRKLAPLKA